MLLDDVGCCWMILDIVGCWAKFDFGQKCWMMLDVLG